jgi:predicted peptidase
MQIRRTVSRAACAAAAAILAHTAAATDLSNSIAGSLSGHGTSIQYRLFEPQIAPAQKAPLVLFLQGMGDRGTDNVHQTDWINGLVNATKSGAHAAYVLAPQIDTNSWFQSYSNTPTAAMQLTIDALKQTIKNQNVDTSRVYVTGLSMGGMGTWDILQREPGMFAAAVPMSGGGDEHSVSKFKDVPVWAFHGDADTIVPVGESRSMVDALRSAGGDVKLTEIKGGGHAIWDDIYTDAGGQLYDWLFEQKLRGDADADPVITPAAPVGSSLGRFHAPSLSVDEGLASVGAAVPEPTSLGVVALAGLALLKRRDRRRA